MQDSFMSLTVSAAKFVIFTTNNCSYSVFIVSFISLTQ